MIGSLHFYLQQVMHRLPSLASQSWLLLLDTHLANPLPYYPSTSLIIWLLCLCTYSYSYMARNALV